MVPSEFMEMKVTLEEGCGGFVRPSDLRHLELNPDAAGNVAEDASLVTI